MNVKSAADPDIGLCAPEHIERPLMTHTWNEIAFLHWPMNAQHIKAHLPDDIEVDTFDGAAWIGLIPFHLSVRLPPQLPSVPRVSRTLEVNVRTYVRGPDRRRGIWFLSLDAQRLVPVLVARAWYRIPYMWARMDFARDADRIRYRSRRRLMHQTEAAFDAEMLVSSDETVELSPLERFLTCRWRVYAPGRRGLTATQVEHPPWKLRRVRAVSVEATITEPFGIRLPAEAPIALFSPGTEVRWGRRRYVRALSEKGEGPGPKTGTFLVSLKL